MKKLISMLLALMMILSLATTAFAADGDETATTTYTLTLSGAQAGHTYTAYQIFTGDLHESTLSNIVWGSGVSADGQKALGDAATKAASLKTAEDAAAFATAVAPYLSTAAGSVTITANATSGEITDLAAGYYLVKTTGVSETNDVYTYYIMKVVKDTDATIKADAPEVEKTVDDNDANIGDTVTFTLTATMPSNIQGYETYKVVFHDTLSAGLAFVEDSVKIKIGEKDVTNSFTVTEANGTLTISCDNVLATAVGAAASSKIVVTYEATVEADAVIGVDGNSNKVYLEYSNDPNWDGKGTEPTGDTPEEEVKVYTWQIPVFKYTGTNTPLAGAGFTLYTDSACTKAVNLVDVTPAAEEPEESEESEESEDTEKADTIGIYKVCTLTDCSHTHVTEVVTNSTGKFEIEGLQKGTYYLKETTTPAGYNTCPVVTVVIGDNGALTQNGTSTSEVAILNQAGSTLPETGGMGTTMFYIVGGLMVLAAVVLLVTKKRMASAE